MSRYATQGSGTSFKQATSGNHLARCVELIDIGTQHGEYQGEPNVRNQIILRWELPFETISIEGVDKPMLVSRFYTNSLSEKANLRRDLESWRSRAFTPEELMSFDLMNVLGKPCTVSVVQDIKGKAKVMGVSALPKGSTCPPAFNELRSFWLDEWDQAAFEALPEGFQRIIRESDEYRARFAKADIPAPAVAQRPADYDDDIPF